MSFPLSFCISPYPADWNMDVITGALVTFLHHEDAGYILRWQSLEVSGLHGTELP